MIGPLLFLVYINDLNKVIKHSSVYHFADDTNKDIKHSSVYHFADDTNKVIKHSSVYHFADDTNLLNINSSTKKLQREINQDLKCIYKWLLANKISLNRSKTEMIIFHKPGQQIKNFKFKIKINGHMVSPSDHIKYLRIHLDSTLSGNHHRTLLMEC